MARWLIKTAVHRGLSWLPGSQFWNELFQRYVTGSLNLTLKGFEEGGLAACRMHLDHFLMARKSPVENFRVLELGTGWYPVVPLGLFLCGAGEIWTYDIVPLLRRERLEVLGCYFLEAEQRGTLRQTLPEARPERMRQLEKALSNLGSQLPAAALEQLNIHALVQDARQTGLPNGSIDLFFSTVVLAHIPREILVGLFAEFWRLARPGAVMSHQLNLKDQFAGFDHSLSPLNYLRYSPRAWKFLDSPLIPQNRLRISDFRELVQKAGFKVIAERNTSGSPEALKGLPLAPEFQGHSEADLLVLSSWLAAQATQAL